jgi:uncharacterized protein YutE (UPF0331/DUF86 family)
MLNIDRLTQRLNFMSKYIKRLEKFTSITLEEYLNNEDSQLIVERILELTIHSAIDINQHLITKHFNLDFTSAKNSFLILKDNKETRFLSQNRISKLPLKLSFLLPF